MQNSSTLDIDMLQKMANTIRFLSADMIESANSGHPGAPFGLADIMTMLSLHLKHNPKDPDWLNRDRLVFSGGHNSSMIYSLLHLWGYDLTLEELKRFRQYNSKTPGHPEYKHTCGIEITTGPLGQGVANAVGMAMASKYASRLLNSEVAKIIDHKVYCMCGDGDIQEGVSYEACSLAGHQNLNNLILIYDNNNITIEGKVDLSFSEDVKARFESQKWEVVEIDGHDYKDIDRALKHGYNQTKPLLIIANTTIAKNCATKEGSHKTHGAPLGADELGATKEKCGFDRNRSFHIDEDVLFRFRVALEIGDLAQREWNKLISEAPLKEQNEALEILKNRDTSKIVFPTFEVGSKIATRESNGKILNAISKAMPQFIGGSADLSPSNKTELEGMGDFPNGKNIRFGIREHAMGSITNGIARYGLFEPFCATFFVFSDYMTPACRMAALMGLKNYFIWTHDSIGVGEDGATHQPIEHLTQIRALPNFYTFRPADANENIACWRVALEIEAPCGFVLSRQGLKVLDNEPSIEDIKRGGYLIKKSKNPKVTLLATGSEVEIAIESAKILEEENILVNVVSVPCFDLFSKQSKDTIEEIIDKKTKVVAIEAARGLEWYRFAQEVVGIDSFGISAPAEEIYEHFEITPKAIVKRVKEML